MDQAWSTVRSEEAELLSLRASVGRQRAECERLAAELLAVGGTTQRTDAREACVLYRALVEGAHAAETRCVTDRAVCAVLCVGRFVTRLCVAIRAQRPRNAGHRGTEMEEERRERLCDAVTW